MPSLELNAEHDEVKASGARGYILLYLDNKPSMRWRFYESMKLKIEWDDKTDLSSIHKTRSLKRKLSAQSQWEPSSNVSDSHCKALAQITPFSPPKTKMLKSKPLSPPTDPVIPETKKQNIGSLSTLSTDIDNDWNEDEELASANESEDSSSGVNRILLTSVESVCRYCGKVELGSEKEEDAHLRNLGCQINCIECQKDFRNTGELLLHQLHAHGWDVVSSHFPSFDFIKTSDLDLCTFTDSKSKSTSCPICQVNFPMVSLGDHISNVHFGEEVYKCCVCGVLKNSKNLLTEHLLIAHKPQVKVEEEGLLLDSLDSKLLDSTLQTPKSSDCDGIIENKEIRCSTLNLQEKRETPSKTVTKNTSKACKKEQTFSEVNKLSSQKQSSANPLVSSLTKGAEKTLKQDCSAKGKGRKTCQLCKTSIISFRDHFETPSKKINCSSCIMVFKSQAHLILHQDAEHNIKLESGNLFAERIPSKSPPPEFGEKRYGPKRWHPCPICGVKYRYCSLLDHIKNLHTKETVYKCCVCDKSLSNNPLLKEHIKTHLGMETKKGKWHCSLCPAVFTTCSEFQRHSHAHRAVCVFCNKDFSFKKLLNEHYQKEHKDSLLSCRICGHQVATKQQLWTHERYHKYKKAMPCYICGTVIERSCLKQHLASFHKESGDNGSENSSSATSAMNSDGGTAAPANKYLCSMCPETFPSEGWLVRHMTTIHKQVMGYKCPQCPKRFSKKCNLSDHVARHINLDKKSFICSVCGKALGNNYSLKIHMNIHEAVKMFRCNICDQGFNYKVSLQTHMVSKHGIGKKKC